jgi:hypothetical protein
MAESPPQKKEARAANPRHHGTLEVIQTTPPITEFTFGFNQAGQKERFEDSWLLARINHLNDECAQRDPGRIAKVFLKEAKNRYRQFIGCGCPRIRFLAWSACNVVHDHLIGRTGDQLSGKECR